MCSKGLLLSRGGTSLLAATYDPPSPTIHTHTQAPGNRLSFPLYSRLDFFHQLCLFPFSHLHLSTLLDTLVCVKSNPSVPPGLYLSLSLLLFASLSSFHYPLSCLFSPPLVLPLSPLTIFLSRFYLPSFLAILLLKSSPCSFSVLYSLLSLQLSSVLALFFFVFFSFPLRPLTLYFPLAFLTPLFSFSCPFLLHSGCRGFVEALSPQWDIQREKELKSKLWGMGGRGEEGKDRNKGGKTRSMVEERTDGRAM